MRHRFCLVLLSALTTLAWLAPHSGRADERAGLEFFEKKIRPLFAENCHACHGEKKQRNGLRLDSTAAIRKGGDRGSPIVPGAPERSLLLNAVRYADPDLRMPPKGKLAEGQVADLVAWIKMGAPMPRAEGRATTAAKTFDMAERLQHWAYQPVKSYTPPEVKAVDWPLTAVDRFIRAKLEDAGLKPAPPLERRALIRRLTFDLIGLPPTPAEVEAFVNNPAPDAYERLVERLLASPHYGERWGRHWLDLVRFSETLGHEFDYDIYNAWRYRDYVVRGFNSDLPYDQFVIEHLAGDLLPNPRRNPADGMNESIVGTASFWFGEGKHGPVDLRQEQADRIDNQLDVLGKAFLAQTVACARCHDHKFDAIPTQDYYALFGYLKSSRYQQAFVDPPGRIAAKAAELQALQNELKKALAKDWRRQARDIPLYLNAARKCIDPATNAARVARADGLNADRLQWWIEALAHDSVKRPDHPMHAWHQRTVSSEGSADPASARVNARDVANALKTALEPNTPFVFESFDEPWEGRWFVTGDAFGPGPTSSGDLIVDTTLADPIRLAPAAWAHSGRVSVRLEGELRSRTFTIAQPYVHVRTAGRGGRINLVIDGFNIIRAPIYGGLTLDVNHEQPQWRTMDVRMWLGHRVYFELLDTTTPHPSVPLANETLAGKPARSYLAVDEIWFSESERPPDAKSTRHEAVRPSLEQLARQYADELLSLCDVWSKPSSGPGNGPGDVCDFVNWLLENKLLDAGSTEPLLAKYREIEATIPAPTRAPALADGTGEDEYVFLRGNYRVPGVPAPRRLLTAVAGAEQPAPALGSGRLELARRLASPQNPLFARVLVNRLWQHHFGRGIVPTPDDFGRMGEPPTHPELLDYLAAEFARQNYSIKAMHRLLLRSRIYQMGGQPDARAAQIDPTNRLWQHVPVRRLEAEALRDAMLAVAGSLDVRMEGPSVPPYLTPFMEGRGRPGQSGPLDGDARRSVYLQVRRNFLNPMFLAFDYPTPFSTIGRRTVSNVPAQALTLMNDPFVLQQAARWAERLPPTGTEERVASLYLTAFARLPTPDELAAARAFVADQAKRLNRPPDDPAVWTDLCHVLMNAKEFVFVR